jgi:sugar transferase (PEP-CTERM/EpsH1 system associated)
MDLIDVDSQKWKDYAERCSLPMRWIYEKEATCLSAYEKKIAAFYDSILLVSEQEKKILMESVPNSNVIAMPNGVDSEYFSPDFKSSLNKDGPMLTFTGVMDYWPNVEGVKWFVENILPRARNSIPDLKFYIVGSRPDSSVKALKSHAGVEITGYVDDVRHYLAAADVCVAPLRIARGIQNKVLEAFAMGKALVCTPQAVQGLKVKIGQDVLVAEDEAGFAGSIVGLVSDQALREKFALNARQCAEKKYSWTKNISLLDRMIEDGPRCRN